LTLCSPNLRQRGFRRAGELVSVTAANQRAIELVVTEREELADGVVGLTLGDPCGRELPEWTLGAHLDLVMTDIVARQYSLCSDPADRRHWKIGVLLQPDGLRKYPRFAAP
jgi:ferredoxin-NADP reductase